MCVCVYCLQPAMQTGPYPIYFPAGVSALARDADSVRGAHCISTLTRETCTTPTAPLPLPPVVTGLGENEEITNSLSHSAANYSSPVPKHSLAGCCHVAKRGQGSHRCRGRLQDLGSAAGHLGQGCAAAGGNETADTSLHFFF